MLKEFVKNSRVFPYIFRICYPSRYTIFGSKNCLVKGSSIVKNCRFDIRGNNNRVIFNNIRIENSIIRIYGNHNLILINDASFIKNGVFHIEDNNGSIVIGRNCSICGETHLSVIEGTSLLVGDDCLFSSHIMIATGDSHSIINRYTEERVNPSKDINIGNHVWFGHNSTVLKGVSIGDDNIIGACSVVSKSFTQNGIAVAGNPARVVKESITWSFDRK